MCPAPTSALSPSPGPPRITQSWTPNCRAPPSRISRDLESRIIESRTPHSRTPHSRTSHSRATQDHPGSPNPGLRTPGLPIPGYPELRSPGLPTPGLPTPGPPRITQSLVSLGPPPESHNRGASRDNSSLTVGMHRVTNGQNNTETPAHSDRGRKKLCK